MKERLTRRELLKSATAAAAGATALTLFPHPLLAHFGGAGLEPLPPIQDPKVKELALRAIEASRSAGASYADVRLTHLYVRRLGEVMHVGVRTLVNGYWGFAASPVWTPEEMVRLGREAVHQAKTNALGKERTVEFTPITPIADGHWTMPVKRDPFTMDPAEIKDLLDSLVWYIRRPELQRRFDELSVAQSGYDYVMMEKAFASSEGGYCTQRLYRSSGIFEVVGVRGGMNITAGLDFLSPAAMGWELYRDHDLQASLGELIDRMDAELRLPVVPVEVGRYDTVMDARNTAFLLDQTIGRATELDRALGYEANAGGTSYINDPLGMVGSFQVGGERLTVTANRSEPGGCATVKWDDEGVTPDEFSLVKAGVLTDFQTVRESAGWLKDYYIKRQLAVRSHGCSNAPTAREAQLSHTPNLVLSPGAEAQDFDALVRTLKDGIAVMSHGTQIDFDMDFQSLTGLGMSGSFYRVKNGRRVARIQGAAMLFRSPELWKGLLALGGPATARRYGMDSTKGEPVQGTFHSVTAPPAVFKQVTLIDPQRKA